MDIKYWEERLERFSILGDPDGTCPFIESDYYGAEWVSSCMTVQGCSNCAGIHEKMCLDCGHSLKDNKHGPDQNDFTIDENGKIIHSGVCTYCSECRR